VSKVLLFTTSRDPAHACLREIVTVTHSLTHFIHSVTHTHSSREQPEPDGERPKRRFEASGERHEGALALVWSAAARATMTSTTELKNSIQMKLEQTGEYDR
jgi:hypothetical protein